MEAEEDRVGGEEEKEEEGCVRQADRGRGGGRQIDKQTERPSDRHRPASQWWELKGKPPQKRDRQTDR